MTENNSPINETLEETAWGYLASEEVGRVAVVDEDGTPSIYPVNYAVDGESVVFRSAAGSKLSSIVENDHVAFEVDGWNDTDGWSVILRGTAEIVSDADELARCDKLPLLPWIGTVKSTFVRISPTVDISGRTFKFDRR